MAIAINLIYNDVACIKPRRRVAAQSAATRLLGSVLGANSCNTLGASYNLESYGDSKCSQKFPK
ncbi:hypothetical protein H6F42_08220 [Pseudanabaena sp. FACHB-1998]|uniref:hypothetical protein n=1 Tax=Pseudanabaena sp. FACHB-1998 TaxID=2692858 RepID=UPI00168192A3|nr:hypothetical protein [Pseudanabaena sp. FACHB-1998]MBD2176895.1 hypothetical protein [Pseudanabaena sp. FACHB-1998]